MSGSTIRKMKILALPLTAKTPKRDALTYYHFITRAPAPASEQGYVGKAQAKAASIWAGFGKAEGGWKQKVFTFGEKAFDRLEYEEIALSGLDPTLGPKLRKFGNSPEVEAGPPSSSGEKALTITDSDTTPIALVHPTFVSSDPEDHLRRLTEHRSPKHKRGALTWVIVAPFTAPFAIIPIIPNLPFFFCVWRAWTHYKAFRASDYLAALFKRGAIVSEPSTALDDIYARHGVSSDKQSGTTELETPVSTASQPTESESHPLLDRTGAREDRQPGPLLLHRSAVPEILRLFDLPDDAGGEIYRAIEQARQRTADGRRSNSDVEK